MAVGLDLDQYQLRKRVLIVFASDAQDVRYEEQRAYIEEDREELDDWKIVVFGIFEEGPSFAEDRPISHEESLGAREDFDVEEGGFGLRLVDLDGTEILSSSEPLPVPDIIDVVAEKQA